MILSFIDRVSYKIEQASAGSNKFGKPQEINMDLKKSRSSKSIEEVRASLEILLSSTGNWSLMPQDYKRS